MNCVDDDGRVMKQLYVEIDKATKHLYDDKQMEQVIRNIVEARVNSHIINRAHEILWKTVNDTISHVIKSFINANGIPAMVRFKTMTYFSGDDFERRVKEMIETSSIYYLSQDITLKELNDFVTMGYE